MKDRILVVAVILAIGSLIAAVMTSQTARRHSQLLDQERYNRMVAEEKLDKAQEKLQSLESALTNTQNQIQNIQAVLEKEKVVNENLREELDKMVKLKEVLEKELKDALVAQPPSQPPSETAP